MKNQEQEPQKKFLQDDGDEIGDTIQENAQEIVEKAQQEVERSWEPWYKVSRRTQILIAVYCLSLIHISEPTRH